MKEETLTECFLVNSVKHLRTPPACCCYLLKELQFAYAVHVSVNMTV